MLLREYFALNGGDGSVNYGKATLFYTSIQEFNDKIESLLKSMNLSFIGCNSELDSGPTGVFWVVDAPMNIVKMHFGSKGFNPPGGALVDGAPLCFGNLCINLSPYTEDPNKTTVQINNCKN